VDSHHNQKWRPVKTSPCIAGQLRAIAYSSESHLQCSHPNVKQFTGLARKILRTAGYQVIHRDYPVPFCNQNTQRCYPRKPDPSVTKTCILPSPSQGVVAQESSSQHHNSALFEQAKTPSSSAWQTACLVCRFCPLYFHFLQRHVGPANAQVHEAMLAHGLGVEQVALIDYDGIAQQLPYARQVNVLKLFPLGPSALCAPWIGHSPRMSTAYLAGSSSTRTTSCPSSAK